MISLRCAFHFGLWKVQERDQVLPQPEDSELSEPATCVQFGVSLNSVFVCCPTQGSVKIYLRLF